MSSSYAGVNTYHASVVIPSDGDPAIAESVNAALRALTDDAVYLNTQLGHQAFDDRGKTSTITGAIVLNNGGGSADFEIPVTFGARIDLYDSVNIHGSGSLVVAGESRLLGDVSIGNTGTDSLTIVSTSSIQGEATFESDVTFNGNTTFDSIVTGDAEFNGHVQIGNQSSDTALVKSRLTVDNTFSTTGSYQLGDGSSDTGTLNGSVTCANDVEVDGALDVFGDFTTRSTSATNFIRGDTTFDQPVTMGDLSINGQTVIGNQATDNLTINSRLISPLTFNAAGRIPQRQAQLPDQSGVSISVSDGELFWADNLSVARNYLVSDTGATNGDVMEFFMLNDAHDAVITLPSGHQATLNGNGAWCRAKRINGSWYFMRSLIVPPVI